MVDTDNDTGEREQEGYELLEDVILLNGVIDRALYSAMRYYATGYDHKREDTVEELETLRSMLDERTDRYKGTDS